MAFIAITLVGLYSIVRQVLRLIKFGSYFVIEILMSVVVIGVLFIGVTVEVAMVLLLFLIGERLEGWVVSRARQGVSVLMALKLEIVTRLRNGEREEVAINSLRFGDVIEVVVGGRLFVDGKLFLSFVSFDESVLIGEFISVERVTGDKVFVGVISVDRLVTLEVLSESGVSVIDRILKLIEEVEERRVFIERFIDRFSRIYTSAIMVVVLLVTLVLSLLFVVSW